jgi:hypothetical protein
MTNLILSLAGLVVGALVGLAFGAIQNAAALRNEKRQEAGKLGTGWAVMPGSFRRVAFLMVALALVQIGMPMLFTAESQWMVSAGVVLGYGFMLFLQFRRRVNNTYGSVCISRECQ